MHALIGKIQAAALAALIVTTGAPLLAQQMGGAEQAQAAGRGGRGGGGGGGGGGRGATPPPADGTAGFRALFNGSTLDGWDGDPKFWSVQNGIIVAESTEENRVEQNTFLIWDGVVADFELKMDYRFAEAAGNSGVQIRSRKRMDAASETNPLATERRWGIAGYQVDFVNAGGTGTGLIYGEASGGHVTRQGQIVRRSPEGTTLVGMLGDAIPDAIKGPGEWNSLHVIAKGNLIAVLYNGRMTTMAIDESRDGSLGYALSGLLALQMHTGPAFRVEFRNIMLKDL
jgi:hypothetical protein